MTCQEVSYSYRCSRSNTYHRHKRNDSDSSTVSSASSYNVTPSKHGGCNKNPVLLNNNAAKRGNSSQSNKHTTSGKHPQSKSSTQSKPVNQFNSSRQSIHNHKKVAIKQQSLQSPPTQEKEIVPSKTQASKPPEKQIDLEPSQFPPLSSNSASVSLLPGNIRNH